MGGWLSFADIPEPNKMNPSIERIRNTTHVVCLGYISSSSNNISSSILNSLITGDVINKSQARCFSQLRWATASKFQKGVHASSQILSFQTKKFSNKPLKAIILNYLPKNSQITIFDELIYNYGFNASRQSEGERFACLIPSSVLCLKSNFQVKTLNSIVYPEFAGKHNFHNYTKDKSNEHLIFSIKNSEPFVIESEEYYLFYFHGKRFGKSQIQRIITMIISFLAGKVSIDMIRSSLSQAMWKIPKFPNYCLFFDGADYRFFVDKLKKPHTNNVDVEFSSCRSTIEMWKQTTLYPAIIKSITHYNLKLKVTSILEENPPKYISDLT